MHELGRDSMSLNIHLRLMIMNSKRNQLAKLYGLLHLYTVTWI